jgi:NAD(P)-dependent dehydrogenase (short-subunit alcohol dehydrogenase family)
MTGKVAVVTGASQDIGAGIVAGLRGQGWDVVACDRAIAPSRDPGLLTVSAGIAGPADADRVVDAALERFDRIDTLVNNAGRPVSAAFTDCTAADYAAVAGSGLAAFFWLTRRAVAEMATRYGGHVVTVTPAPAGYPDSGAPAVLGALATGALVAATRALAAEYAAYGIRVNAVAPGVIAAAPESYGDRGRRLSPLGRPGEVSDIVGGVLFLESAPYVTGQVLQVNGGPAGHG